MSSSHHAARALADIPHFSSGDTDHMTAGGEVTQIHFRLEASQSFAQIDQAIFPKSWQGLRSWI